MKEWERGKKGKKKDTRVISHNQWAPNICVKVLDSKANLLTPLDYILIQAVFYPIIY